MFDSEDFIYIIMKHKINKVNNNCAIIIYIIAQTFIFFLFMSFFFPSSKKCLFII